MKSRNSFLMVTEGFLIGGVIGTAIALLTAPQTGAETRHDINKYTRFARIKRKRIVAEARAQSKEMVKRAEEILDKTKTYASGKYSGSAEGLEKEIQSLKNGFTKAIETYRNYNPAEKPTDKMVEEIFVDFDSTSVKNTDDESLPKHEGMGRRAL